ncbi:hypothetical protein H4R21_001546, partial [Coemansia helicoidea]
MSMFLAVTMPTATDETKLIVLLCNMTGEAKKWAAAQIDSTTRRLKGTPDEISKAFTEHFQGANDKMMAEFELARLKQTGSVRDYITEFNAIIERMDAVEDYSKR